MEKFAFFPSNNGDRIVQSKEVAEFLSQLFTNGIFNNGCKVVSNDNMSITIKKGFAFINGHFYLNDNDLVLPIGIADANQSRIDNVVIRYSAEDRNIKAQIIQGDYSTNPVAPDLERNTSYYDLKIAQISINQGTDKISTSMIKDCRFNSVDCGNVIQAVQHLDTNNIFEQYDASFYDWFNNLKLNLNSNVASNLQNEIDSIENKITLLQENVNSLNENELKVLWENPNPTGNFDKQNIQLSTDNYSYFDVLYYSSLDTLRVETARIYKDCNSLLNTIFEYNMKVFYGTRKMNRISDTEYEITAAATSSSLNETTMNVTNCIVPIKIIGRRR